MPPRTTSGLANQHGIARKPIGGSLLVEVQRQSAECKKMATTAGIMTPASDVFSMGQVIYYLCKGVVHEMQTAVTRYKKAPKSTELMTPAIDDNATDPDIAVDHKASNEGTQAMTFSTQWHSFNLMLGRC